MKTKGEEEEEEEQDMIVYWAAQDKRLIVEENIKLKASGDKVCCGTDLSCRKKGRESTPVKPKANSKSTS